jgi:NitT/TauT family transport system permease protein
VKVYFETADLFAWTLVIVLISVGFEKLFLRLLDAATERIGAAWN